MIIDNFEEITSFVTFKEGTFYKFEALIRSKDGENPITKELPNSKKNLLLRTWYIENEESLKMRANEMREFCRVAGARLYMTTDRKKTKNALNLMFFRMLHYITTNVPLNAKTIVNKYNSVTSLKEVSDTKKILFDIDTKDKRALEAVLNLLNFYSARYTVMKSLNGYHVVSAKSFPIIEESILEKLFIVSSLSRDEISNFISVKANALCLVFFDTSIYDN